MLWITALITFLLICFLYFPILLLGESAVHSVPLCFVTHPLLLFFLVLWWQSGFWVVCLLCHDMLCCVTAAAWSFSLFLFLLLHPGSPTTLTYVSAADVILYNCTRHMMMLNSSPALLVAPSFHPTTSLSITLYNPPPPWQDFLGQVFCTLGEIVGSPASRLEKPLVWVSFYLLFLPSDSSLCQPNK